MFSGIDCLGTLKCKPHYSSLVHLQGLFKIRNKELNYLIFQYNA